MKEWTKIYNAISFQGNSGVRNTRYTTERLHIFNLADLVNGKANSLTSNRYILEEQFEKRAYRANILEYFNRLEVVSR